MEPEQTKQGAEAAAGMMLGWNLGNSYDCHGRGFDRVRTETSWGNPVVTRDFIRLVAKTGFSAIRIPVTWYPHMNRDGEIDGEWLKRVRRVVRMSLAEGLYCILSCKHDCGGMHTYGGGWICATRDNFNRNREKVRNLWSQVATYFSQESDLLLFEGFSDILNEQYEREMPSAEEMEVANDWNQLFVDTVRQTGGLNAGRNLIVTPYAAGTSAYLLSGFRVPEDSARGHLLAGIHLYTPLGFTSRAVTGARQTDEFDCLCEEELERAFMTIDESLLALGLPVVITEFGAMERSNSAERARYCGTVTALARVRGIPCLYWDDGVGYSILRRAETTVRYPEIISAMLSSMRIRGNE